MIDPTELFETLDSHLDVEELEELCFYLDIDYEKLGGTGKSGKVIALIRHCERHDNYLDLVCTCYKLWPHIYTDLMRFLSPELPHIDLPDLLGFLVLSVSSRGSQIVRLCQESARLRKQGQVTASIQQADLAVSQAHDLPDPILEGIALLYRSFARWSCHSPEDVQKASQDCETALCKFSTSHHHRALTLVFQAQKFLEMKGGVKTLDLLESARKELIGLVKYHQRRGDTGLEEARKYESLLGNVRALGLKTLVDMPPELFPTKRRLQTWGFVIQRAAEAAPVPELVHLDDYTLLILPEDRLLIAVIFKWRNPGSRTQGLNDRSIEANYIEVNQVAIDGKLYAIQGQSIRLFSGRQYIPLRLSPGKIHQKEIYVLIRNQDEPDQPDQRIVVLDNNDRMWITRPPPKSEPRIIGGSEERWWKFHDGSGSEKYVKAKMLGIVEAVLTPLKPAHSKP